MAVGRAWIPPPKKYSRPCTRMPVCQIPSTCFPRKDMDICLAMPRLGRSGQAGKQCEAMHADLELAGSVHKYLRS